jgi:hypothetical protein
MSAFYERKVQPTPSTADLWFEKIKYIPEEALKPIEKRIQGECEHWPYNITSTMASYYSQWLDSHPEKRAHDNFFQCSDCSEGLIFAKKVIEGKKYSYVFRCTKCRQNHNQNYPAMSRLELMENYEVAK